MLLNDRACRVCFELAAEVCTESMECRGVGILAQFTQCVHVLPFADGRRASFLGIVVVVVVVVVGWWWACVCVCLCVCVCVCVCVCGVYVCVCVFVLCLSKL